MQIARVRALSRLPEHIAFSGCSSWNRAACTSEWGCSLGRLDLHSRGNRIAAGSSNCIINNTLEIDGGTVFFDGNYSLGHLLFNGTARFDFQSGSSIVHFTKVGYPPPALDGDLGIYHWKGSAQSPGRDQFYIDGTDQYMPSRLQMMYFVDPADIRLEVTAPGERPAAKLCRSIARSSPSPAMPKRTRWF